MLDNNFWTSQTNALRCIDLFAGCGGLSLGLLESGWHGVFAIERDPMAFETLSRNFLSAEAPYQSFALWPTWLPKTNHDIVSLLRDPNTRNHLKNLRGTITLIAGGPPCQGFSVGGRRDGKDERNNLAFHMLDMVSLVQPRAVLIENVEGIIRRFEARPGQRSSSIADEIMNELAAMGYTCSLQVVDSNHFGVPQARRRVTIVGLLNADISADELKDKFTESLRSAALAIRKRLGLHPTNDVTAKEALHDLHGGELVTCPDSPKFKSGKYTTAKSAYAKAMRGAVGSLEVPNCHRFSVHGPRIQSLYALAHSTQPPGRLSKSFLLENNTKKDKKVLIDPHSAVSTITTHPDEFIHYAEPRNITVREMARLQSFPDDFNFYGRYTINGPRRKHDVARCSQVGNAVPPLMAEAIGLAIRILLEFVESDIAPSAEILSLDANNAEPDSMALAI